MGNKVHIQVMAWEPKDIVGLQFREKEQVSEHRPASDTLYLLHRVLEACVRFMHYLVSAVSKKPFHGIFLTFCVQIMLLTQVFIGLGTCYMLSTTKMLVILR